MKIGIYTLPLEWNYGGILQAYALSWFLREHGHESVLLQRRRDAGFVRNLLKRIKWGGVEILARMKFARRNPLVAVEPFKWEHLVQTRLVFSSADLARLCHEERLDAVIVGSDQVWRKKAAQDLDDAFLAFVPEGIAKIAYAASFGVEDWEYDAAETRRIREHVQGIAARSVRERSGCGLTRVHLGCDSQLVLDPTVLAGAACFGRFAGERRSGGGLVTYVLDPDAEKTSIVSAVAQECGLKVRSLLARDRVALTVEEWVTGMASADFIVTDSFHGTCFALMFGKPFVSLGNAGRGNARFASVLGATGLEERLVASAEEARSVARRSIDWTVVQAKLSVLRTESAAWLVAALGGGHG